MNRDEDLLDMVFNVTLGNPKVPQAAPNEGCVFIKYPPEIG